MRWTKHLIRNYEAGDLLDAFMVSAVVSLLGIRFFLELTGYPKLGGDSFHIAHMLYGGLLMMVATVLLLAFLNRSTRRVAAVIGGFGFGTFIDELGKFITSDNDYFYQPTAALIYLIFILIYLGTRQLRNHQRFRETEYLANAVELLKEASFHDLDSVEKDRAGAFLTQVRHSNALRAPTLALLKQSRAAAPEQPGAALRLVRYARQRYQLLTHQRWFSSVIVVVFGGLALAALTKAGLAVYLAVEGSGQGAFTGLLYGSDGRLRTVSIAVLGSSLVSAGFIISGLYRLPRSRYAAYEQFERALLVSIFITYVFEFAESQFTAVFGLGFNVLLLAAVRYMQIQERAS